MLKRVTRLMLDFKSFRSAENILAGINLTHRIREGQRLMERVARMFLIDQFYVLAGKPV